MTEEQIKQYGDMIRRLGSPIFDPPFTSDARFIRIGDAEYAARAVEAILREQQTKHQEKVKALRQNISLAWDCLSDAGYRLGELEKLLRDE